MVEQADQAKSFLDRASVVWLNVCFWSLFPPATLGFLLGSALFTCIFLVASRDRRRTRWLVRRLISWYGRAIVRCGWPLIRVQYVDHGPQDTPPFVFVANHRSASDAFLMGCLRYECIEVLNNWPSKIPGVALIAWIAQYLKVRQMSIEAFVDAGSKLLSEGVSIIMFPEGTRSGSRRLGPFHGSAFRLAQTAGAKIVPVAIAGSENIPRRGSLVLHPGRIVVSKLPALTHEQYKDLSPYKLKTLVRERIREYLETGRV